MKKHLSQGALVVLLAAVVPACGQKMESGSMPAPGGSGGLGGSDAGPKTLFSDDFSGVFPGTAWSSPSGKGTGTSASIASGIGNPPPSLAMTTTAGPAFIQTENNTIVMKAPFTITVQIAVLAEGEGSGAMNLVDLAQIPRAAVEWHPVSPAGSVTFMITDSSSPPKPATSGLLPPAPGPTFHTFTFSVDGTGTATWMMDSTTKMSQPGFPTSGPFAMRLYDNITATVGPFATFHFDNVKITAP